MGSEANPEGGVRSRSTAKTWLSVKVPDRTYPVVPGHGSTPGHLARVYRAGIVGIVHLTVRINTGHSIPRTSEIVRHVHPGAVEQYFNNS